MRQKIVQSYTSTCAQTSDWQSAEAACKQLISIGLDSSQVQANLASAAQIEAQTKEQQRQQQIAELQQDIKAKLDEATQLEQDAANLEAQANNMMPRRSPILSPFEALKLRGYTS